MERHHLVPQMYLRNFSDSKSQLTMVNRDDPSHQIRTSVKNACVETGFYDWAPELDPDTKSVDPALLDPKFVEQSLSRIEARAEQPIARMISTGEPPISEKDRYNLTNFVALQATRTRTFREDLDAFVTWSMRNLLREQISTKHAIKWLKERGEPHTLVDANKLLETAVGPNGPTLSPEKVFAIQQSLRVSLGVFAPNLWLRSWVVVSFDTPALLTSDEPVVSWHPGGSPVTPLTAPIVWLPLSRHHLLEMRLESSPNFSRPGTDAEAGLVNSLVATQANRWIIHHPDDSEQMARLNLGPRTQWGGQILDTIEEEDQIRVRRIFRRFPTNE